jgi:hypothetical protein
MVAADFLPDLQVRQWLDGIEAGCDSLTFESLRSLAAKSTTALRP